MTDVRNRTAIRERPIHRVDSEGAGHAGSARLATVEGKRPGDTDEATLLRIYLRDIRRHGLLSKADEVDLAQQIESANLARVRLANDDLTSLERHELRSMVLRGRDAQRTFIESNLLLVVSIAKMYRNHLNVSVLDRIQDGNLGLIRAVDGFDWRKGFKFSTYAHWPIRNAIRRGIDNNGRAIHLPHPVAHDLARVRAARARLEHDHRRAATISELAVAVNMIERNVAQALQFDAEPRSLNEPAHDRLATELGELIEDRTQPTPLDAAVLALVRRDVRGLLAALTEREKHIIVLRFGLEQDDPHTLDEIGRQLGLTRERIRQVEAGAIAKLRQHGAALQSLLTP